MRSRLLTVLLAASLWPGVVYGASTTLGNVVEAGGNATPLRVGTGDTVQATCGGLVDTGMFDGTANRPATSAGEDLLFRCNEMVHTANALTPGSNASTQNNTGLDGQQLAEVMQQLAGEEQASKGRLATETSNGQFANVGLRLDAIRQGARATAGGLSLAMQGVPVIGGNAGDAQDGGGWSWFANGALGFGDRDGTSRENGYDHDSYGATLGADYRFGSGFVGGFAVGYADFEVDFDAVDTPTPLTAPVSGGDIGVDGYSLTVFGIGSLGAVSIDGLLSYGENDYDTSRIVSYTADSDATGRAAGLAVERTMTGSTDGSNLAAGVNASIERPLGAATLYFDLGLSYLDVDIDGYTEADPAPNGGLNLAYEDQSFDSLQSSLGLQIARPFSTASGVFLPYARAEWRHEFRNDSESLVARYAAAQDLGVNVPFAIQTDDPDENFAELSVGVSALFSRNLQMFVDYRTTVGLRDTTAHLFTAGIRGTF